MFIMDVPTYSETLFITDAAINIFPDLDAKRDIVQNAIDLFTAVGLGKPRVAILSAVETVTTKIPSTIDAAALCKMADRGQITGAILDGPLAFDNAIDPEAARIKGIHSAGCRQGADPGRARSRGRQHARQKSRLPGKSGLGGSSAGCTRAHRPDVARGLRAQPHGVVRRRRALRRGTSGIRKRSTGVISDGRASRRQCRLFKRQIPDIWTSREWRSTAADQRSGGWNRHSAAVARRDGRWIAAYRQIVRAARNRRCSRCDCRARPIGCEKRRRSSWSRSAIASFMAVRNTINRLSSIVTCSCGWSDTMSLAPLHQPNNLAPIRSLLASRPELLQVACFDTAFHRTHSAVADHYAIPERFYREGVRRYGFHGLSYEYVVGRLREVAPDVANGRVIIAHLGSGASMCALSEGRSIESTMGFTALDGLPMGTRPGQIDPGVLIYMMNEKGMSSVEVENLLYRESGLKGISGISNDMRELEASDAPSAALAIDYFVHRIGLNAGMLAAALGGLDAFVFTAGIGEHSIRIRARIAEKLGWLGIDFDPAANAMGKLLISPPQSDVRLYVVPTDEELMIARHTLSLLAA